MLQKCKKTEIEIAGDLVRNNKDFEIIIHDLESKIKKLYKQHL